MIYTIVLFILAGVAEMGGGYLVWLWLREGRLIEFEEQLKTSWLRSLLNR